MSDLITALTSLFTFLSTQIINIADVLLGSTLGQLIIGIALFTLIVYMIIYIIGKVRG